MYNQKEKRIIAYIKNKVRVFLSIHIVPGHDFNHAARVAAWAVKIAQAEKANVFLCELAGWLHDVGRCVVSPKGHHEISYEICQRWFKEDSILKQLSRREKIILLYSVRYHWNNVADKYQEAIILRDADKLDLFGKVGIRRFEEYFKVEEKILDRMRFLADDIFWLRTRPARKFFKEYKLFEPVYKYIVEKLKKRIKSVRI